MNEWISVGEREFLDFNEWSIDVNELCSEGNEFDVDFNNTYSYIDFN
jgi:hypothetical protein